MECHIIAYVSSCMSSTENLDLALFSSTCFGNVCDQLAHPAELKVSPMPLPLNAAHGALDQFQGTLLAYSSILEGTHSEYLQPVLHLDICTP